MGLAYFALNIAHQPKVYIEGTFLVDVSAPSSTGVGNRVGDALQSF